jgi:hypothetical protein
MTFNFNFFENSWEKNYVKIFDFALYIFSLNNDNLKLSSVKNIKKRRKEISFLHSARLKAILWQGSVLETETCWKEYSLKLFYGCDQSTQALFLRGL